MIVSSALVRAACGFTAVGCAMVVSIALAAPTSEPRERADLSDLSFDELTSLPSVRNATSRSSSARPAASVQIITQDEIRRSGATTLPDALRSVPGLYVQQIDASRWSIGIRGFSSRFANKVQVLVDGRSLYTPSYGGVYWDANDTFLDDIERIEITRGPGDASTPMNAINGTIHIITKHADQTQGVLFNSDIGMGHPGSAAVRYGGSSIDSDARWRTYAKYSKRDHNEDWSGHRTHDEWEQFRAGARMDLELNESDDLRLNIDAYDGSLGQDAGPGLSIASTLSELESPRITEREQMDGAALTAAWMRLGESGTQSTLRAIVEYAHRSAVASSERRTAAELQFGQVRPLADRSDLEWGVRARFNTDSIAQLDPQERQQWLYDAYAQDHLYFWNDRLTLSLGARLEDTQFGAAELSPNLRVALAPTINSKVWAAVSRGVRATTRMEHDAQQRLTVPPSYLLGSSGQSAVALDLRGSEAIRPESVIAYETGVQFAPSSAWAFEASAFYNDYRRFVTLKLEDIVCNPGGISMADDPSCLFASPDLLVVGQISNNDGGQTWGGEVSLTWRPLKNWQLIGGYAMLRGNVDEFGGYGQRLAQTSVPALFQSYQFIDISSDSTLGLDPTHQYSMRSLLNVNPQWDFDFTFRRSSSLPFGIPAYSELDARVAWRPSRALEVAIAGSNLLHGSHQEGVSNYLEILPTRIQRSVYAQLRWAF